MKGYKTRFSEQSHEHMRALQAYLILIGLAQIQKSTITYEDLCTLMDYRIGAALGPAKALYHIRYWCEERGHPQLSSIVVSADGGLPSSGAGVVGREQKELQSVFEYDWFSIFPPDPDEQKEAFQSNSNKN